MTEEAAGRELRKGRAQDQAEKWGMGKEWALEAGWVTKEEEEVAAVDAMCPGRAYTKLFESGESWIDRENVVLGMGVGEEVMAR